MTRFLLSKLGQIFTVDFNNQEKITVSNFYSGLWQSWFQLLLSISGDLNQVGFAVPIVQTVAVPAVATDHHATYTLAVNTVKTVAIKLLINMYTI